MPTLSVKRDLLYSKLGRTYSEHEFDELCFQFGIELDEVTSERQMVAKEQGSQAAHGLSDDVIYKIELPANRYDLLTVEGLSRALRCFLNIAPAPEYAVARESGVSIHVDRSVADIRPIIVGAVLRGMTFTPDVYDSFIELQDKLHSGIGRRRTLVSIGTHDLAKLEGPVMTYEALPPTDIRFVPLNKTVEVDGPGMMAMYESDLKLRKFLPIIRDFPRYPVVLDGQRRVASLPPIINSDMSKITLATKDVLVEVTATDEHKANVALTCLVTSFAEYCQGGIESVRIVYPDGRQIVTPVLDTRTLDVSVDYIVGCIGKVQLDTAQVQTLLAKMMLASSIAANADLTVTVPCTRSDILHACDVMEDVAIAYGFNNIPHTLPTSFCVAAPLPLNKLSDQIRREIALCGYTEVLSLTLCSRDENYKFLRRTDPGNEAVVLENPKTLEYQQVHTLLLPEMLKTLNANKAMPLPHRIFQVADVCLLDSANDVGARNERHLSVLYSHAGHSGLETVHGVLDRLMQVLNVQVGEYELAPSTLPYLLEGRQCQVALKVDGKSVVIGSFGIVHPETLRHFEVGNVVSALEINIEPFL